MVNHWLEPYTISEVYDKSSVLFQLLAILADLLQGGC